ncbi:MAG TPA: hypothetical protein VEA16_02800, partial [Vicinamibacterales bacterium]|nr:hypothetical protein [Vicinamibacterales bacterium]
SKANYTAFLNSVQFSGGDDVTLGGTRGAANVEVVVFDQGGSISNTAVSVITLSAVNDAPVNTVPSAQVTDEDTALVFSSANGNQISVADPDAATVRVQLTVTNGTLTLSGTTGLAFNAGANGTSTMTFTGTKTAVNAALNGLSYAPTANFSGASTLTVTTSDLGSTGSGGTLTDTDTVGITVNSINDAPSVGGAGGTLAYTEGAGALVIDAALVIGDVDNTNVTGATVRISNNLVSTEDVLSFTSSFGITGSYDASTGTLTLSGTATLAQYEQVLESVRYTNTNTDHPSNAARTVTWNVTDGMDNSAGATSTITVARVNDAPVNTVPAAQGTGTNTDLYFGGAWGNAVSVADVDNANVTVTLSIANGTLTLAGTTGLAFTTGDGTADATMTFSGTQAAINAALDGMRFTPNAGYTGTTTLNVQTSDGAATDTDTVAVTVAPPPRVDLDDSSASQTATDNLGTGAASYALPSGGAIPWAGDWVEGDPEGGAQSPTAGDVYIFDGDATAGVNNLIVLGDGGTDHGGTAANRATIQRAIDLSNHINASLSFDLFTSGTLENADTYDVQVSSNGGASWTTLASYSNDVTGTQTVSLAGYESANTVIRFRVTSNFAGDEAFGIDNVVVNAEPSGHTATFTENGAAVAVADADTLVTDDGANITRAVITIANAQASDLLAVAGALPAGIALDPASTSTQIILTGTASKASYQTAIEAIRFSNTSEDPDTTPRVVTVQVRDASNVWSNEAQSRITVVALNDAPLGTDGSATINEDSSHTFSAADFGFTDVDSSDSMSAVRIDSLTLPAGATLQLSGVNVTAGQVITLANVPNLVFTPAANGNGVGYASLTFSVRDQANAFDAAPNTFVLNVTPVNDAPTTTAVTLAPMAEDSGARLITQVQLLANMSDLDSPSGGW